MTSISNFPTVLVDYKGLVQIEILYDDVCIKKIQSLTPVSLPEFEKPLVTLQKVNNGFKSIGEVWSYDFEKDTWVIYDLHIHKVPITPLVEVGTEIPRLDEPTPSMATRVEKLEELSDANEDEEDDVTTD